MQELYKQLLVDIGEDVEREGLHDTPERAANAMRYLTKGYHESLDDIINDALFESDMNEMLIYRSTWGCRGHGGQTSMYDDAWGRKTKLCDDHISDVG